MTLYKPLLTYLTLLTYILIYLLNFLRTYQPPMDHRNHVIYQLGIIQVPVIRGMIVQRMFSLQHRKIGRIASTEIIIHLLKSKCLSVSLYGLNACILNPTESKLLEFEFFRTHSKIYNRTHTRKNI